MKRIWKLSHLWLAILSFGFLLIAGLTGIILATESIADSYNEDYKTFDLSNYKINTLIKDLKGKYDEVFDLEVRDEGIIIVNLFNSEPEYDGEYILNPRTGRLTSYNLPDRNPIYEWSQTLHRSLFLETTGRNIMAIIASLLSLIVISGISLIVQRQQSWQKFYSKIVSSHFSQFSHVWLGRIFLFPLLIVTITALLISVERLGWLENHELEETNNNVNKVVNLNIKTDNFLNDVTLADINKVEFPFSEDEEDYYRIYFKDRIVNIAQYSHQVLSIEPIPIIKQLEPWAQLLHTGKGSWQWAFILFLSAISVIYFVISGGIIFYKRTFNMKNKNKYTADKAEIIVLYGSENGSTKEKAIAFYKALLANNQFAYISDLNHYSLYPNIQHLVIFTSTYGDGEAPENAAKFIKKLKKQKDARGFRYSIVGFGSIKYPKYNQFAKDCYSELTKLNAISFLDPVYINRQNIDEFKKWWILWSSKMGMELDLEKFLKVKSPKKQEFKIVEKTIIDDGHDTVFNLWIKPKKSIKFESGDLLAILPPEAKEDRYYSISKIGKRILISVKLHEKGLGSQYLYKAEVGSKIPGYIKENKDFHLNINLHEHIFIANGTGIAPFIGMIKNNDKHHHFAILGLRNKQSYSLYEKDLRTLPNVKLEICYSREEGDKRYLQEAVEDHKEHIIKSLLNDGELLICGSLAMAKEVLQILEIAMQDKKLSIQSFEDNHKIKMDCY